MSVSFTYMYLQSSERFTVSHLVLAIFLCKPSRWRLTVSLRPWISDLSAIRPRRQTDQTENCFIFKSKSLISKAYVESWLNDFNQRSRLNVYHSFQTASTPCAQKETVNPKNSQGCLFSCRVLVHPDLVHI